jgi:hypothetical protein
MDNIWLFRNDVYVSEKFDRFLVRDAKLDVQNSNDIRIAAFDLQEKTNSLISDDVPPTRQFSNTKARAAKQGVFARLFHFWQASLLFTPATSRLGPTRKYRSVRACRTDRAGRAGKDAGL